jgi:hypothetical protein
MPKADAASILTTDDVISAIDNTYNINLDGGASVTDGNESTATYLSDPIGSGDPVIVQVINPTDAVSPEDIWNNYESNRISRSSAEFVEDIGEDAYIAYPSIHVFDRGCEIVITAGSGSDDGQSALLEKLAQTAVSNIESIMPEVN